jgi:hypothetical protein
MRRIPRSILIACISAVFGSMPSPAPAATISPPVFGKPKPPLEGKKPVAVGTIAGKRAGKVRALIFERFKESNAYEVTDAEDLKPGDNKFTIAKVAKAVKVAGVVMGRVSEKYDLTLVIYNATGKLVREVVIKGGTPEKLENAIRNEFNLLAGEAIAKATGGKNLAEVKPPAEIIEEDEEEEDLEVATEPKKKKPKKKKAKEEEDAEEEDAEEEDADKDEEEEEDEDDEKDEKVEPSKPGRAPFEALAGVRGYNRSFSYTSPVSPLLPYKLGFGPALLVEGRVFPAAFFRDDYLGNIGVVLHAEFGIATSTDYVQPVAGGGELRTELSTRAHEWNVGLVFRIPVDPIEVHISAAYGDQRFVLIGDEGARGTPTAPLVPDVSYQYFRPGVEGRLRMSEIFASVHVAPRFLLSLHQVDQQGVWFRDATGSAFDAGFKVGYGVLPYLDVVAGFDFLRYAFDFSKSPRTNPCGPTNPDVVTCNKVAGGATDMYISGWIGAMVRLGGSDADKK